MTALELKTQIDKELDKLSEKTLEDILAYIKKRQFNENVEVHFETFVKENDELLRRLAE